jgi:hypothetical protein
MHLQQILAGVSAARSEGLSRLRTTSRPLMAPGCRTRERRLLASLRGRWRVHLRHSDAKGRGTVWNPGRLLLGAGRPERSAIGTEQEQGIRSRLPALVRQPQTEQMSAAAVRSGRPSGWAAMVGS